MLKNQSSPYISILSLLCFVSHLSIAYADIDLVLDEELAPSESSASEQFFKDLYGSVLDYDGNIGAIDFFRVGKRHHRWAQLGLVGPLGLVGAGTGYRYLIKGSHPYQNWFTGFYGQIGWARHSEKKNILPTDPWSASWVNNGINWKVGAELGTAYHQWTINGYGHRPLGKQGVWIYKETDIGISGRWSSYYFQKMRMLGRINPFVFGSYTKVNTILLNRVLRQEKGGNLGAGLRWEMPYLTIEGKALRDSYLPSQWLGLRYQVAMQINFSGNRDKKTAYVRHRVFEMPQAYQPFYVGLDVLHVGELLKEIDPNTPADIQAWVDTGCPTKESRSTRLRDNDTQRTRRHSLSGGAPAGEFRSKKETLDPLKQWYAQFSKKYQAWEKRMDAQQKSPDDNYPLPEAYDAKKRSKVADKPKKVDPKNPDDHSSGKNKQPSGKGKKGGKKKK